MEIGRGPSGRRTLRFLFSIDDLGSSSAKPTCFLGPGDGPSDRLSIDFPPSTKGATRAS